MCFYIPALPESCRKTFFIESVKPCSRAIQINFDEDSDDDEDDRRNSKADIFFDADVPAEQMHDNIFD